jgi:hypothetical protein
MFDPERLSSIAMRICSRNPASGVGEPPQRAGRKLSWGLLASNQLGPHILAVLVIHVQNRCAPTCGCRNREAIWGRRSAIAVRHTQHTHGFDTAREAETWAQNQLSAIKAGNTSPKVPLGSC